MKISNTDITLEELLDQLPLRVQFVDKDGFLRYMNKADALHPAKGRREIGVQIRDCHAQPKSIEIIERIFGDFKRGRKEPHFFTTSDGRKSIKVPIFNTSGVFIGVLSYSYPIGSGTNERTF